MVVGGCFFFVRIHSICTLFPHPPFSTAVEPQKLLSRYHFDILFFHCYLLLLCLHCFYDVDINSKERDKSTARARKHPIYRSRFHVTRQIKIEEQQLSAFRTHVFMFIFSHLPRLGSFRIEFDEKHRDLKEGRKKEYISIRLMHACVACCFGVR